MRIVFAFLILSRFVFAQFDPTMYDLIKTTYERSFDKQIIYSFLNSNSPDKIRAAILSISQSDDTSFVPSLLQIDLSKFGDKVCFAIGQIGTCTQSLQFLWDYLKSLTPNKSFSNLFYALGKIGSQNDLEKLESYYNSFPKNKFPYSGISKAILQFQLRGITNQNVKSVLETEVEQFPHNSYRVADALFVLARYNSSDKIVKTLNEIFTKTIDSKLNNSESHHQNALLNSTLKEYALMNFQRLKYFDADKNVVMDIINGNDEILKIELAKTIVYWNNKNDAQKFLSIILKLINDKNKNVAIQAANSFKNLDTIFVDKNKELLHNFIIEILNDPQTDNILKSELFLSGFKLLGNFDDFTKMISLFNPTDECKIEFAGLNPDKDDAISNLIKFYKSSELKLRIETLTQIINSLTNLKHSDELKSVLNNALLSDFPPLISIAADGLDSTFISDNSIELKNIIQEQISKIKDDPDFLEATLSLINLSKKIDSEFYHSTVQSCETSKLYSVRKYIGSITKNEKIGFKESNEFEDIWKYSFKYSKAKIITSKGIITIKFIPEIAPISVGNFCKLADQHFYDGILFHRVVPGFVIQTGDPTSTGWGGPGYDIISEFSDTGFTSGYVGMASAGKDTEGSQFFIMQGSFPHLDGRYSNFANVVEGMEVVFNITQNDKIISIELIE